MKIKKRIFIYLILAFLCCIYALNVAIKGYGTMFFVIWLFIALGLVMMSYGAHKEWWKRFPKWVKRTICIIVALGLAIFVWVEGLIVSQINAKGEEGLEYVIVLGAQVHEEGPSSILAARLRVAIKYLNENPDTKVIVSGAQGSNEPFTEAEGMRRYLVEKGIAEDRIIMEPNSFNTTQNITNSMELIGDNDAKVGIATSNFHVYRACKIAKKQGLNNVSGLAGNVVAFYLPQNMFREFFGIVKDTMFGNM